MNDPTDALRDAVVIVAGAGGGAGPAVARRLAAGGALVVLADRALAGIEGLAAEISDAGGRAAPFAIDFLDEPATQAWAAQLVSAYGRVDGLVHLVGGWRGGQPITEADLADWELLEQLLIRTVQHTSRSFHDLLRASDRGRFVLISGSSASHPTATDAIYATAKAAAETWTLALADSFRGSRAAATILIVKALLTPAMREAKPEAKFSGYTPVDELAEHITMLWERPAEDVNGARLWLTEQG
jgi:NADP-dependent 3-hydroxy acid dehydrogenase YdfG